MGKERRPIPGKPAQIEKNAKLLCVHFTVLYFSTVHNLSSLSINVCHFTVSFFHCFLENLNISTIMKSFFSPQNFLDPMNFFSSSQPYPTMHFRTEIGFSQLLLEASSKGILTRRYLAFHFPSPSTIKIHFHNNFHAAITECNKYCKDSVFIKVASGCYLLVLGSRGSGFSCCFSF